MNRWYEQFKTHPIHTTLQELSKLINVEFDDTNGEEQSEKRRLLKLITFFEETLNGLDAELIPYSLLDQANTAIRKQNLWDQFKAYNSSGASRHLKSANEELNNVLVQFSQLLAIAKRSEVTEPLRGLEKSVDEFTNTISSKKKELANSINEISASLTTQNNRLSELSEAISKQKEHTNQLLATWQDQHSNAQDKRNTDFIADQKSRTDTFATLKKEVEQDAKTQIKELIEDTTEKLSTGQKDFNDKLSSFIEDAEKKHADILKLHELVAGDSVVSGYLQSAENDKKQANFWRWTAIFFIFLTAGWTGYAYITDTGIGVSGEMLWGKVLKAFSVTGVLLFGAAYSAKQSNSHRQSETQARWFALNVKAIDPFISSLSEDNQSGLKYELTSRLFAQQHKTIEKDGWTMDEHTIVSIVKRVIEKIKVQN